MQLERPSPRATAFYFHNAAVCYYKVVYLHYKVYYKFIICMIMFNISIMRSIICMINPIIRI